MAEARYGSKFSDYMKDTYSPLDFLLYLADTKKTVLLPGYGFAGPRWPARVSLANLMDDDYTAIGISIREALTAFHESCQKSGK